jgi:hypothetical protein
MSVIVVRRPSRKAMNPERPASSLLLTQIQHLQHAENNLPLKYCSDTYTKAIRTEGEAAAYIREVTEAIHQAHRDAAVARAKRTARRRGFEIAAAAEEPRRSRKKARSRSKKSGRSKSTRKK